MPGDIITFVPTTDPARARDFYAGTLGLELEDENEFALVFRVNGTMLRVTAPGGGRIAWFKDPDGNTLSLAQFRA